MLSGLISLVEKSATHAIQNCPYLPMNEAELVHSLDRQCNLGHVETSDVFREDLVLDQHCHQITPGQELHQHVQKRRVLERSVQLDEPRAVGVGEDVALGSDMGKLVFFVL
jgi:hypothetical protein